MVHCTASEQTDLKSVITTQIKAYLNECTVDEANGNTFSGEAWAYNRVLKFLSSIQTESAAA